VVAIGIYTGCGEKEKEKGIQLAQIVRKDRIGRERNSTTHNTREHSLLAGRLKTRK
jgi:hypothetical protein